MAYELVAQGTGLNANELANYENYLQEGQRGMLQLNLRWPVNQGTVNGLEDVLREEGVEEVKVTSADSALKIEFRQGSPWLIVIVTVILGIMAIAILVIGWKFFREVTSTLPPTTISLAVIAVIVIGVLAIVLLRRR